MSMKVKDLFKISLFKNVRLIAGESGLDNEIIWFNLMEIIDSIQSLEKGEFLISTGYAFDQERIAKNLISKLKAKGLAGIGIQLGYYIETIPQQMLEDANREGFPIIEIPKKLTFSHITRAMYKELMMYQQEEGGKEKNRERNTMIVDILENKTVSQGELAYLETLLRTTETSKKTYLYYFHITHKYDGIILRSEIQDCVKRISNRLREQQCMVYNETIYGKNIILFSHENKITINEINSKIGLEINTLYKEYKNLKMTLGMSSPINTIEEIKKAYQEAALAQQQLEKIQANKGMLSSSNLGLAELFNQEEVRAEILLFSRNTLKNIVDYDRQNKSEYFITLECYLRNNGHGSETAKQLFIHRHTLSYRLEHMEKLFHIAFGDATSLLKYGIAIYIYHLYD